MFFKIQKNYGKNELNGRNVPGEVAHPEHSVR